MAYEYLKNNYNITEDQFKNILCFLAIILNGDSGVLIKQSPDYIIEKYHRYVGDYSIVKNDNDHLWGAHPALVDLIKLYHETWQYPTNWKLKPLLKNI